MATVRHSCVQRSLLPVIQFLKSFGAVSTSGLALEQVSFGLFWLQTSQDFNCTVWAPLSTSVLAADDSGITGFTCKRNRQVSSSSNRLILFHSVVDISKNFRLYRSLHSFSQIQFSLGVGNPYPSYLFSVALFFDSPNSFNPFSFPMVKRVSVPAQESFSTASVFLPS